MHAEMMRTIVAAVPLPVIAIGRDERIVAANPGALVLFGSGIEGRHHLLSLRQPALQEAIAAALRQGMTATARL